VGWLLTPGQTPLAETLAHFELLESRGFDSAWVGEAFREVVVSLAAAATRTERLRLGSGILQIFPVNPVMVAQQAAQLAELSDGRFALGVGLGADFVVERWFGVDYDRPLLRMREFIEIVKGVLAAPARGPFTFSGEVFSVRNYPLPFATEPVEVPIYLAAVGPQMQRLAGELADGIVVGGVNSEAHLAEVEANLARGAERTGRDPSEVEIVYGVPCAVWPESERARELGRGTIVYSTQYPHYRRVWESEGHGELAARIAAHVRAHEMDAAVALVDDDLLDRYTVTGTPAEARASLTRYRRYPGRPLLSLMPFRMSDEEAMEALRVGARELPTWI
jgi:alkanesulfonate monooxygenase SsuD/methylene tetrahydromethanopterin reductase-like flavin-dependent oxidoreductase (luciferase family)